MSRRKYLFSYFHVILFTALFLFFVVMPTFIMIWTMQVWVHLCPIGHYKGENFLLHMEHNFIPILKFKKLYKCWQLLPTWQKIVSEFTKFVKFFRYISHVKTYSFVIMENIVIFLLIKIDKFDTMRIRRNKVAKKLWW